MDTQSILIGSYATVAGGSSSFAAGEATGSRLVQWGNDAGTMTLRLAGGVDLVNSDAFTRSFALPGQDGASGTLGLMPAFIAGAVTASKGQIVFSNANSISFGLSTAGASATLTVTAALGGAALAVPGSTNGGTLAVFSNANNMSFGLAGSTLTASVNGIRSLTAAGGGISSGTASLGSGGGYAFGLSTQTNGSRTLTAQQAPVSYWDNSGALEQMQCLNYGEVSSGLSLQRVQLPRMTATRVDVPVYLSSVFGGSGAGTYTLAAALYTMSGSTAGLASSASQSVGFASGTNSTASSVHAAQAGSRWRSVSAAFSVTPGEYLLGLAIAGLASNGAANMAFSMFGVPPPSEPWNNGEPGFTNATPAFAFGVYTGDLTTALGNYTPVLPATIQLSQIIQTALSSAPAVGVQAPFARLVGSQ